MAQPPEAIDTYVALDLETTGLNPETDSIIEIGAVKFRGEEILDTFHTLINPHTTLSYYVKRLTGISQQELESAPALPEIADKFTSFVSEHTIVGQSLGFDLGFLSAQDIKLENATYDTLEMAKLLLPQLPDYSLAALAAHLGIPQPTSHRALPDAVVTRGIFLSLLKKAEELDPSLISRIVHLTAGTEWALRPLFVKLDKSIPEGTSARSKERPGVTPTTISRGGYDQRPGEEIKPLDIEWLTTLLENDGALAKALPAFEYREGQTLMMQAVAQALNNGEHLIVEAGTGTGKSIAYLLPAAIFASQNKTPIVISTNTINLQEQLINKDIPILLKALGLSNEVRTASLKGRGNYLCLRRWNEFQQKQELSSEEIAVLIRLLVWLHSTSGGDCSELNLNWMEMPIWERVCAQADNCLTGECPYHQQGECFLYRARQKAAGAHLVVVNHALLVSDLVTEGKLIPPHDYLIIDEAHHLEGRATEQIGFRISQYSLLNHLNRLSYRVSGERRRGLLPHLAYWLSGSSLTSRERRQIERTINQLEDQISTAAVHTSDFFDQTSHFVQHNTKRQGDYERRLRLTPVIRQQLITEGLLLSWQSLKAILTTIESGLHQLYTMVQDTSLTDIPDYGNLITELSSILQSHSEMCHQMNSVIAQPEANGIYWLSIREGSKGTSLSPSPSQEGNSTVVLPGLPSPENTNIVNLCAAPLHVGSILEEHLFSPLKCAILTGATLSIESNFNYIKEQLGLIEANELLIAAPFDYQTSTLIYLPTDIPEPGTPGYQRAVETSLVNLCRASRGRTMVLFTSHSALRTTRTLIQPPLEEDEILVVGQGINGGAKHLLDTLKANPQTVLLGASSLWEGVDIPGDALSVVVIARLPFGVPDDPIHQARSELFEDGFSQYTLPQAIIRFKQGFGRLIRSKTDRGVVVILDRRLQTKYYGDAFLMSLPPCTIKNGSLHDMPREVAQWLES